MFSLMLWLQGMAKAGDGLFGAGVKGTVRQIPAGWQQLFILSAGSGILDGALTLTSCD